MSVSRSFSTLSPYYVYKAQSPKSLGFGSQRSDSATNNVTIAASPTVMIASSRGSSDFDIWYTSDVKNWTRSSSAASAFGTNTIFSMCFGNNIFVAVGDNAVIATSPSTDGGTWTNRTKAAGHSATEKLMRVYYFNDRFIIWGEGGYMSSSTDGITWTNIGNVGQGPFDAANGLGGSGTIIYNSYNSSIYAFPDNYEQAIAPQTKYYISQNYFSTKTTFSYSGTNGAGARFVYARDVNGNQAYIGTTGRTSSSSSPISGGGSVPFYIEVARTTVDASTYNGTGISQATLPPILWPTSHGIPSLSTPVIASSTAQGVNLPSLAPDFGGTAGAAAGFWVNYENGYWNLIGNFLAAKGASSEYSSLGCGTARWKEEEGVLESFYNVRGGALFNRTATTDPVGLQYSFNHRVTQTNGGNEVVFKDKIYICAERGTSGSSGNRDIIVGSRKLLPLRTTVNY